MHAQELSCSQDSRSSRSMSPRDRRKHSLCKYESPSISSYVDAILTDEIDETVRKALEKLYICQRRLFKSFPKKLAAQRRYVIGYKQARKCLVAKECLIVLFAPDIDEICASAISELKRECAQKNVPYVFALSKREYSRVLHVSGSFVGVVSVMSVDGARDLFLDVLNATI
mmetsp:Transcript_40448/g.63977  ORF Transcript_40448/g.63977 Transcript_40448/m.63977 type:complete len:171 (-) Transcript_40448:50-562(-)